MACTADLVRTGCRTRSDLNAFRLGPRPALGLVYRPPYPELALQLVRDENPPALAVLEHRPESFFPATVVVRLAVLMLLLLFFST